MVNLRRILHAILGFGLCLTLAAQPINAWAASPAAPRLDGPAVPGIPDSYELVGDNAQFQLYADRTSLAFKVVDKRSGYLWNSNLDELAKGDRLNKTWAAFARSGLSIEYLDQKAVNKRASITNSTCDITFERVEQGYQASVTFKDYLITVGLKVQLLPQGVRVEIPAASIREESPDYKLGLIHVFPFFGATRADSVAGYMFIPDGAGSLIRFAKETKAQNMFYGRYYGDDLGMITSVPWDPTTNRPFIMSIPVTGMVHGEKQNAYIAIVEKGAAYGEIQAHPAGILTNFNFMYNAFVYNESYFQATNRSGAGVTTLQKQTNQFDIQIQYRFLTGSDSDYVGMARSYQQYLVEQGVLHPLTETADSIGVKLEFLGGEKEKFLLWYRLIGMTTVDQMGAMLKDLNLPQPEVVYYGWQPLGASSMPPHTLRLDGKLGTLEQLQLVRQAAEAAGGHFALYLNPQAAFLHESGYSPRNDLAMSITNANLLTASRNRVTYLLNWDALSTHYTTLRQDIATRLGAGLALDGIASLLYGDFKAGHVLNREGAIMHYQELMAGNPGRTAYYQPNDYLFGSMQAYYDIPITDSGYTYTSEVVPFLEIVLAGYVPYYGPALNFSSNMKADLLRQVDFGVYPAFFLTQEVTAKILRTPSNWIYTSSYAQWKQTIQETYQWMNQLLAPVQGQTIVARESLAPGVMATTYSNGKQVVVNYTDQPFQSGDLMVNGQDAVIRDRLP